MTILMADKSNQQNPKASSKATKEQKEEHSSFGIPKFQLPEDFHRDPDRYELWTMRLPTDVPLEALEGIRLHQQEDSIEFEADKKKYQITWGNQVENESFRLLASSKKDDADSEDDDSSRDSEDEKETFLYPVTRPFSRHVSITESFAKMDERSLAPTREEAPKAADPLRIAYVPVEQKTGLRRRWQMPGSRIKNDMAVANIAPPPATKRNISQVDQSTGASWSSAAAASEEEEDAKPQAKRKLSDTSLARRNETVDIKEDDDKEAKKAAKRAKKEAKAARREAKKAKKAKKEKKARTE